MATIRSKRIAELIHQELASGVLRKLSDPILQGLSLTDVEMSNDLKRAFVYYSCPMDIKDQVQASLDRAVGFIKRELAPKLALKFIPELVFRHDPSLDEGHRIEKLLSSIKDTDGRND